VLLALLSGCTGGQMTLEQLRRVPGVGPSYPGSTVYRTAGFEAEANAMAKNPASLKRDLCTTGPWRRVFSWYDQQLARSGWKRAPGHLSDSDGERAPTGVAWERGELEFQLWQLQQPYADRVAASVGKPTGCPTPYQTYVS
jgi:hypothetical protein